jgi:hypothetical protein
LSQNQLCDLKGDNTGETVAANQIWSRGLNGAQLITNSRATSLMLPYPEPPVSNPS